MVSLKGRSLLGSLFCVFSLLALPSASAVTSTTGPSTSSVKTSTLSTSTLSTSTVKTSTLSTSTLSTSTGKASTLSTSTVKTSTQSTSAQGNSISAAAAPVGSTTVGSTILVIARDSASAYSGYSGLNAYGIPYQLLLVPQSGVTLPQLNSSATTGNFGAIVVLSEVSYDYGDANGGYQSALTTAQWATLFDYQTTFGVRMARLDAYPTTEFGATTQGGCCANTQEQLISFSSIKGFETAGLKTGATVSTLGLYHYPATISDATIATAFLQFGATTGFPGTTTAGVINKIGSREQMVFFISFATDWSSTSNLLQHSWIHWCTRGLYSGFRRINLGTQVDDMFLYTDIYYPAGNQFRIRPADLAAVKSWIPTIQKKMPAGSSYFMEIGHNGNGNIDVSDSLDDTGNLCPGGAVYPDDHGDTALEFQKPLGSGTNAWPSTPVTYAYSTACTNKDALKTWWANTANRDAFAHVSHTFTHENEDNATYYDIYNEISFNQAWLKQVGIDAAARFSANGLIPPAITGLHNGDALRAWNARGIKYAVGDNTRPALLNTQNEYWPLITNVANNGFDGIQITPRWATNIYYNCDSADCTAKEWADTSTAGTNDIQVLLAYEKDLTSRRLFSLHRDPYMFHQANLRQTDVNPVTINGVSSKLSLIQMWMETVVQEFSRLVTWPMITLKHDDIGAGFAARMALDACAPKMTYLRNAKTVTGVTISTNGNTCSTLVPVTLPGPVTNQQGFTSEKVGSDPLTIWVKMTGSPVTFTLSTPLAWGV